MLKPFDDTAQRLHPSDFPELGTTDEQLRFMLGYAVRAPSSHNTQPWRFGLGPDYVELWADRARALPVVDPDDRELIMSCGAALFHLRVAARGCGFTPEVELMPRPQSPDLLARVRLGPRHVTNEDERQLLLAIARRRTTRTRFAERVPSENLVAALASAAREEGAWLLEVTGEHRVALASIIGEADRIQHADKHFRRELAAWMTSNGGARRDGMPGAAVGLNDLQARVAPLLIRTFDMGRGRAAEDRELAAASPTLVLIGSDHDEPRDWLTTGEALAHVLLRATVAGLAASFLNQPIEVPELRVRLEAGLGLRGHAQIILRLGYPVDDVAPTPRRPVDEVLLP